MNQYILSRLRSAFPEECDEPLYRAVNEGVALADDAISSISFLSTAVGKDLKGHLRRAGVMFAVKKYAERGDLPFVVNFQRQPRGCWHWAAISSKNIEAHIVRTDSKLAFPTDSPNRQDKLIFNNGDLFSDKKVVPFNKSLNADSLIYTWLACGADKNGDITHVMWNTPFADEKKWLANINVMSSALSKKSILTPKTEAPNLKERLEFKEHVQKSLEDAQKPDEESEVE